MQDITDQLEDTWPYEEISSDTNVLHLQWSLINEYKNAAAEIEEIDNYIDHILEEEAEDLINPVMSCVNREASKIIVINGSLEEIVLARESLRERVSFKRRKAVRKNVFYKKATRSLNTRERQLFMRFSCNTILYKPSQEEIAIISKLAKILEQWKEKYEYDGSTMENTP